MTTMTDLGLCSPTLWNLQMAERVSLGNEFHAFCESLKFTEYMKWKKNEARRAARVCLESPRLLFLSMKKIPEKKIENVKHKTDLEKRQENTRIK